jgi:AraC-like DNA-binding protein/ligand-binding sensor protein
LKPIFSYETFIKHPIAREFGLVFDFLTDYRVQLGFCDPKGNYTVSFNSPSVPPNKYCAYVYNIWEYNEKYCKPSVAQAGKESFQKMEPVIYECPFGLIDITTALCSAGHHFANISTGQLLLKNPPPEKIRKIFNKFFKDRKIKFKDLRKAYLQSHQISFEMLFTIYRLCHIFQQYLNTFGREIVLYKKAKRFFYDLKEKAEIEYYLYPFAYSLITGRLLSPSKRDKIRRLLGLKHLPQGVMILQKQSREKKRKNFNFSNLVKEEERLIKIIKGCVPASLEILVVPWKESQLLCFFSAAALLEDREQFMEIAQEIVTRVDEEKKFNFKINIGLGRSYPAEKLSHSYDEALTSLKYASFRKNRQVVHISQFRSLEEKTFYPSEPGYEFFTTLIKAEKKAVEEILRGLKKISLEQGKNWLIKILSELYQRIIRGSGVEKTFFLRRHLEILSEILKAENFGELKKIIERSLLDYQRMSQELKIETKEDLVEQVKEYIEHNYQRQLRRGEVARALNVSDSTLVKTLRKHGVSFIDLLTEKRLERAKELLQNSSLSAAEVGFKVGYQNIHTFYRAFRARHQITPGEYKNSLSS